MQGVALFLLFLSILLLATELILIGEDTLGVISDMKMVLNMILVID